MKKIFRELFLLFFLFGLLACKEQEFSKTTFKKYSSYKNVPVSAVSAENMNIVYVGVDNPLNIVVNGISPKDLLIEVEGCGATLKINDSSRCPWNWSYTLHVQESGQVKITLKKKKEKNKNKIVGSFNFRSRYAPDPIVKLGQKTEGTMVVREMAAQIGLIPMLMDFDFEMRCKVVSFTLYHSSKGQAPAEIKSKTSNSGRFTGAALQAIQNASVGDKYQFVDVRVICQGDKLPRPVNNLVFEIR